jgi:hypothetical protein
MQRGNDVIGSSYSYLSTRPRAGGKPPPSNRRFAFGKTGAAVGCSRQGRERGLAERFVLNCLAYTLPAGGEQDQEANG